MHLAHWSRFSVASFTCGSVSPLGFPLGFFGFPLGTPFTRRLQLRVSRITAFGSRERQCQLEHTEEKQFPRICLEVSEKRRVEANLSPPPSPHSGYLEMTRLVCSRAWGSMASGMNETRNGRLRCRLCYRFVRLAFACVLLSIAGFPLLLLEEVHNFRTPSTGHC